MAQGWITLRILAPVACLSLFTACKNSAEESANQAVQHAAMLGELAKNDVLEVERGLPEGAKRMAQLYANGADPERDLAAVRSSLKRIRRDVADLAIAKSTFFALANAHGVGIRNDLDQDAMAGQELTKSFPELARASKGEFVATSGAFVGFSGPNDRDWVAASPIKREDGTIAGMLVTGWTYRAFARHLQECLLKEIKGKLLESKESNKLPILYVSLFEKGSVFSAPLTPPVTDQALVEADLPAKTAQGSFRGTLTITGRTFGLAALRVPKLGPDTGIAVLRSEVGG